MTADFAERYGPVALVTARRLDRLEELATRLTREQGITVTPYLADR